MGYTRTPTTEVAQARKLPRKSGSAQVVKWSRLFTLIPLDHHRTSYWTTMLGERGNNWGAVYGLADLEHLVKLWEYWENGGT